MSMVKYIHKKPLYQYNWRLIIIIFQYFWRLTLFPLYNLFLLLLYLIINHANLCAFLLLSALFCFTNIFSNFTHLINLCFVNACIPLPLNILIQYLFCEINVHYVIKIIENIVCLKVIFTTL